MNNIGFTLLKEEKLSEVGGIARLWKHDKTGAELLSVVNDDENKSFGVSFRTPPKDSTGVAHILEHSVLCGSRKYPVKEPFVELLKSSLQTFLNALTFPDKTCYPVASTNLQDFYNLIDVYIDAVFYPRIDEDVLRQEGWHIDVDENGNWLYKGVVFNEMKGVYSSPDSVLMEQSQQAVYPDMLYSLDSGGNPDNIIDLTFEEFRAFHDTYYHPSNARFFFWGDDPEEARLERLAELLAPFDKLAVDSVIPLQPHRDTRRKIEVPYQSAQAEGDEGPGQGHITLNWLLCESSDVEEMMLLEMLEHILTGLPGSPLRKALMDSGLGEDVVCGLETDLRQSFFTVGLRSIDPKSATDVETLIMDTLAELAERGVSDKAVEGALNSLEFELRENNTGRFPRGLSAMFRSLTTWLYDGDPFAPLAWEKPLGNIKSRLTSGERVFENAIRRWFLENTHQATVVLLPDPDLAVRVQQKEDNRLQVAKNRMSEAEKQETALISERLRIAQETPDKQEDLAKIPSLGVEDLPRQNTSLPCRIAEAGGPDSPEILVHELDTTGIVYAKLLCPLTGVTERLLPLLPLFSRALTEMGTKGRDYVDLGLELAAKTGNLDAFPAIHTSLADGSPLVFLEIAGKATVDKCADLAGLMREILLEPKFEDRDRFTQMVMEEKARVEQSIIPAGHALVSVRLSGQLSLSGWLSELTHGVRYLEFIRALATRLESDWEGVLADLEELYHLAVSGHRALLSLTADSKGLTVAQPLFGSLARDLPRQAVPEQTWTMGPKPGAEILVTPSQVNYVGLGMSLAGAGYRYHGSAAVIMRHLRMGYLWDRVRVQGGAYGIFANLSRATGNFVFLSYRDPNVDKTLEVYRQSADYLGNLRLDKDDIAKAVVGAIGDLDAYMLPGAKGAAAMWRYVTGDDEATRQRIREEILGTTLKDFHDFAPSLARALQSATPCALGGKVAEETGRAHGWTLNKIL